MGRRAETAQVGVQQLYIYHVGSSFFWLLKLGCTSVLVDKNVLLNIFSISLNFQSLLYTFQCTVLGYAEPRLSVLVGRSLRRGAGPRARSGAGAELAGDGPRTQRLGSAAPARAPSWRSAC